MTIILDRVSCVFPDGTGTVTALNEVSMSVPAGHLTAVVGESGSGKSTLLSVLAGLIVPTSGTVTIADEALHGAPEARRSKVRRERIGMIFQNPNLLASLTVREQVLMAEHLRGRRLTGASQKRAEGLLEEVGLGGLGHRRVQELSGGQRQRVNIARALMGDPAVILADEPTSALDRELSQEIVSLLRGITDTHQVATVMVTHDRSQLDAADEVLELRDGAARYLNATPA
ncbi:MULTISPECIES: ABC transporter ATP-binding protein [unclassified Corynebacterium]|uniref:ABC transporter ATP-binding protein n=1 Tax=unclassified Corynebacterium TaxID=2624378 RepID=UPI0029CA75AA|nr:MULTISPECIES: ABC transporter ATP-binding protein [unclassified Corynebacterium]WPF66112.1 ABC transporter ATP-binding protein [Corynebacterium sp. 22KM0430]WPF68604.1 ABC transporter ATP-binding protein [Corynebacterium sp. 21KM1197]